jgi:hypothetical protein
MSTRKQGTDFKMGKAVKPEYTLQDATLHDLSGIAAIVLRGLSWDPLSKAIDKVLPFEAHIGLHKQRNIGGACAPGMHGVESGVWLRQSIIVTIRLPSTCCTMQHMSVTSDGNAASLTDVVFKGIWVSYQQEIARRYVPQIKQAFHLKIG